MNVCAPERITDSFVFIEIRGQKFFLPVFRQLRKSFSRRIGQRGTDADKSLKSAFRFDENTNLCLKWLRHRFKTQSFSRLNSQFGIVGSCKKGNFFVSDCILKILVRVFVSGKRGQSGFR